MKKSFLAAAFAAGSMLVASTASAVEVTVTSPSFSITNFGEPICEVSASGIDILAVDDDTGLGADIYFVGVTDATGTLGINNGGAPDPAQPRVLYLNNVAPGQGFIDRANIMDPMYLTVWEGTGTSGAPVQGAIIAQVLIPQSALTAGPFPCLPLNSPPTAEAGADQADVPAGSEVTLDGTGSSDPDDDALNYSWSQTGGPAVTLDDATSATPGFTVPAGAYGATLTFSLVVNDGTVDSDPDVVTVAVRDNQGPVADAGSDLADLDPGAEVTLDGTGSSDPDGDDLTYSWTQTAGTAVTLDDATSATPSFTLPAGGYSETLTFSLVVSDGTADSEPDLVTIATRENQGPVADAGSDVAGIIPGTQVTLDGTGSSDPDGDALTYSWTQTSGPAVTLTGANTATPQFEAPPGATAPLVFELVVNDGTADSAPDSVTVSVKDNIALTRQAIDEFFAQRINLLLAHQPDLQRRIDRLQGRSAGNHGTTIGGMFVPGSENVPLSLNGGNGTVSVSTSLNAVRGDQGAVGGSWDIWAEAYFGGFDYAAREGTISLVYAGFDYALSDGLLLGIMGQIDDIGFDGAITGVLEGDGWMVGPYLTARLGPNLFLDARAAFGSSSNTVSPFGTYVDEFDAGRTLLAATLTGEFDLAGGLLVRPEAAVHWMEETQEAYVDALGSTIPGGAVELGQASFAPRIMYVLDAGGDVAIRPFVEARGIYSFGSDVGLALANDLRLRLEGGIDAFTAGGIRASVSGFVDGVGQSSYSASGVHLNLGVTF